MIGCYKVSKVIILSDKTTIIEFSNFKEINKNLQNSDVIKRMTYYTKMAGTKKRFFLAICCQINFRRVLGSTAWSSYILKEL